MVTIFLFLVGSSELPSQESSRHQQHQAAVGSSMASVSYPLGRVSSASSKRASSQPTAMRKFCKKKIGSAQSTCDLVRYALECHMFSQNLKTKLDPTLTEATMVMITHLARVGVYVHVSVVPARATKYQKRT